MGPSDHPTKCVRLEDDKKRRESADSGTSSAENTTAHGMESPGSHRKSESDSSREEISPGYRSASRGRPSNPMSVTNLIGNNTGSSNGVTSNGVTSSGVTSSGLPLPQVPTHSAFSNPSLHSAPVHHRNIQAAAQHLHAQMGLMPGLPPPLSLQSLFLQQQLSGQAQLSRLPQDLWTGLMARQAAVASEYLDGFSHVKNNS